MNGSKPMRMRTLLRASAWAVAVLILMIGVAATILAQSASGADPAANPIANPGAIIISGQARFTVLTPQLIRMEWAADGKFEDHASLVFINRLMPVPAFKKTVKGGWLSIDTEKVVLRYKEKSGAFTAENLLAEFSVGGKQASWHPGLVDSANLGGTARTLEIGRAHV